MKKYAIKWGHSYYTYNNEQGRVFGKKKEAKLFDSYKAAAAIHAGGIGKIIELDT